jgi:hypothetical protein
MDRIKDRGFFGNLSFYLRKMVMTFNDGTFGWSTEVWKNGEYEPAVARGTRLTPLLRQVYDAQYNPKKGILNTLQHLAWMVCLIGLAASVLPNLVKYEKKEDDEPNPEFLLIIFFGVYFYQMLFEARARYLFVFLPILLIMVLGGYRNLTELFRAILERKKTVDKSRHE